MSADEERIADVAQKAGMASMEILDALEGETIEALDALADAVRRTLECFDRRDLSPAMSLSFMHGILLAELAGRTL